MTDFDAIMDRILRTFDLVDAQIAALNETLREQRRQFAGAADFIAAKETTSVDTPGMK